MPQNKARLNRIRSGGCAGGGLGLLERKDSPVWGRMEKRESSENWPRGYEQMLESKTKIKQNTGQSPIVSEIKKTKIQKSQGAKLPPNLAVVGNDRCPLLWLKFQESLPACLTDNR